MNSKYSQGLLKVAAQMLVPELQKQAATPVKMPKMPIFRRFPQGLRNPVRDLRRRQLGLLHQGTTHGKVRNEYLMDIFNKVGLGDAFRNGLRTARRPQQTSQPRHRKGVFASIANFLGRPIEVLPRIAALRDKYLTSSRHPMQVSADQPGVEQPRR